MQFVKKSRFRALGAVANKDSIQRQVTLAVLGTTTAIVVLTVAVLVTRNQNFAKQRAVDSVRIASYSACLLYTSPSPRDATLSRMPSSA